MDRVNKLLVVALGISLGVTVISLSLITVVDTVGQIFTVWGLAFVGYAFGDWLMLSVAISILLLLFTNLIFFARGKSYLLTVTIVFYVLDFFYTGYDFMNSYNTLNYIKDTIYSLVLSVIIIALYFYRLTLKAKVSCS